MNTVQTLSRLAGAIGLSAVLLLPATESAFASKEGRDTLLGAGIGALAGGLLSHGKAGGVIGGAVAGGVAGNLLAPHRKYYSYGYYSPNRHYYRHSYYWRGRRYYRPYYG
jgi:osmotically inducible lipoprotein OsmB